MIISRPPSSPDEKRDADPKSENSDNVAYANVVSSPKGAKSYAWSVGIRSPGDLETSRSEI